MSVRTVTVHAFCSIKGGVGKSTLAVVTARLLAAQGRVPVLLDCDLTGTSLADGLDLRAPRVAVCEDGCIDLDAPPTGESLTVEETRRLRAKRDASGRALPPPYLNDVLSRDKSARLDALLWKHEHEDGVLYLPSSSLHRDVVSSLQWFYAEPFDWAQRFAWLLDDLAAQVPSLTDVVVDLPPGVWGFAHETLVLLSVLSLGRPLPEGFPAWHAGPLRWSVNPMLITSADRNDLLPAIEYLGRHLRQLPTLLPLVNRATEGIEPIKARVLEMLGTTFRAMGLEQKLRLVPESATLARVFKEPDFPVDSAIRRLSATLRLENVK